MFIDSFGLFQLPAATCLWIAVDRLLVHVEPVAPACQLMEVALFVALVVVVFYKRVPTLKVVYVDIMVQQAYAQCEVVQMLFAVADIAIVK